MRIRRRQEDGTFGPLEGVFSASPDESTMVLFEEIASQQEQLTTQLADKANNNGTFYVNGEKNVIDLGSLVNDKFQLFNTVAVNGVYTLSTTIIIPAGKTLDLGNSEITINSDIDGIFVSDRATLIKGNIIIGDSIKTTYSHTGITLSNGRFHKIINTRISNYGAYSGTAIKFDVSATGKNIAYATLDGFYTQGFNIALDITVPNIPPHIADSTVIDNWISTCKIHGFISDANQGLRIYDASAKGQAIQGMDIFLRGQAGHKNTNFDEAIYARCVQSTFNVILDDAGYDVNLVKSFIVFDKDSHANTYIGVDEKVIDNGIDNNIINRDGYFKSSFLTKSDQNNAQALGVINNLLFHANDRFTVTTTATNCSAYDINECFKFGYRGLSTITRTTTGQDSSYTYNINFGTNMTIRKLAIALNLYSYGEKVRFRVYSSDTSIWYDSGLLQAKDHNIIDLLYDLKVPDITKITQIEMTVFISATYTKSETIKIEGLFAYGGGYLSDKGGLLSRTGGKMYGTLDMGSNYFVVGGTAGLPTASATYRGWMAYVKGNGTSTADILYICLMASNGTYSWKQLITG